MFERFKRTRDGDFRLNLSAQERDALATVPAMLRSLVEASDIEDPAYRRLFPPAYLDDEVKNEAFAGMVHDDLAGARLDAASILERTLGADRLSEEQAVAWLSALNDARIVLGSRLAVTEDTKPEDVPAGRREDFELLRFLGYLVGYLVVALGGPSERDLAWGVVKRMREDRLGRD